MTTTRHALMLSSLLLAACAQTPFSDDGNIHSPGTEALQNYYKNPNPDRALSMIQGLIENRTWSKRPDMQRNLAIWASQILRQSPQSTEKWCNAVKRYDITTQHQAAYLFHLAGTPESRKCFQDLDIDDNIKQAALNSATPDLLATEGRTITDLNGYWAVYYATGNPQAIEKMLSVIQNGIRTGTVESDKTTAATVQSLRKNMRRDPVINRIVQNHIGRMGGADRSAMNKLLSNTGGLKNSLKASGSALMKRLPF